MGSQTTIADCLKHAAGYKYFGLGCPTGGFECWRGNDVNDDSIPLDMQECTGTPLTNIGNGAANGGCSGFPTGTFTMDFHGFAVPLGGWHREPVYDRTEFIVRTSLGICYGSASGRPLGDHSSQTSISDCIAHSAGYKYFGLGCPTGGGFECWRGNDINGASIALDMQECTGTPLTNIGNGAANGGCSGYPTGTFTIDYNGVQVPLGGWHREPVYDRAAFLLRTEG